MSYYNVLQGTLFPGRILVAVDHGLFDTSTIGVVNSNLVFVHLGGNVTLATTSTDFEFQIASTVAASVSTAGIHIPNGTISFGSQPGFAYSEGHWNPIMTFVQSDADGGTIDVSSLATGGSSYCNVITAEGYYVKNGSLVTVMYNLLYQVQNLNLGGIGGGGSSFGGFRNLPFEFKQEGGFSGFTASGVVDESSWPNGKVGTVAAPAVPTYAYPYNAIAFEQGGQSDMIFYDAPPFPAVIIPVNRGPHTFSGFEVAIDCRQEFYELVVDAAPPFVATVMVNSQVGYISAFFMTTINQQFDLSFRGTLSYISTD